MTDFTRLSRAELESMAQCGRAVLACEAALARAGETILSRARPAAGAVEEWRHYPDGDVYDPASHAQYFYHAHPAAERALGEDGHFHTFLRARGMPPGARPLVMPELAIPDNPAAPGGPLVPSAPQTAPGGDEDAWSHLIAIALGASGWPVRLFTTNRWVTGETWYTAADVVAMLDRFALDAAPAAQPLDGWVAAMLGLYRPQIAALLQARDEAIMGWRRRRRGKVHVFEDRRLEITSAVAISLEAQLHRIAAALRAVA